MSNILKYQNPSSPLLNPHKIIENIPVREWGPRKINEDYTVTEGEGTSFLRAPFQYWGNKGLGLQNEKLARDLVSDFTWMMIKNPNYNLILDKNYQSYDDAINYLNHLEGLKKYLHLPYDTGLLMESKYKPTRLQGTNEKTYKFKSSTVPGYWDDVVEDMVMGEHNKNQYYDQSLNEFTAYRDRDEKGDFVSIYDEWDYNPAVRGGNKKLNKVIDSVTGGKPFVIYDRVYLDDYYDIPEEARGNPFITPSVVTANEKHENGGILKAQNGINMYPVYGSQQKAKFAYDAGSRNPEAIGAAIPTRIGLDGSVESGNIKNTNFTTITNNNGSSNANFESKSTISYNDGLYNTSHVGNSNDNGVINNFEHHSFGMPNGDRYYTYNNNGVRSDRYEVDYAKRLGMDKLPKPKTLFENGGILKAQEGTGNGFWSKLWNAIKEGGMAARDAKLGAVGAQQVRDLYSEGKNQEAQDLAKQYAKANTTGIALAGGAASTGLLGDLMVTGATTAADTFIDGDVDNFGKNLSLNAAFDLAGHGAGKLLRNVDWGKVRNSVESIPDTKADISEYINTVDDALPERQPLTIQKSPQFWDGTSKSKLSVDEKMGLPKSERNQPIKSNPNAGAVTNVDTYLINRAYAPWEIRDGKFIFKMGEPINVRGLSERAPVTFHFTTDTQVKPHSGGDGWANAKTTYLVPYKSVVKHNGMPANIEPMDTWWTAGSTFEFPTQDVKVLTADPKVYRQYKARGIDVEFSPEGRKLVRERKGMSDIVEQWIRSKQDQFGMRPTVDTYRQMERETGLSSNVRPKKKHLFGDYFEETNVPDYHTGPATHSNSWSFPAMANIGLPDDPKYFMSSIARNVALDLSKYKTFTFKDLPALQKLAQTHKQFDIQLPTTYGVKNEYSWDFSGQEELVDKINKILRGEIVVPYEQGGKL